MEKRNKIRDWEDKRDDLNEKLDNCQDKLRLVKQDEKPPESKTADDLLTAAKVRDEFIISTAAVNHSLMRAVYGAEFKCNVLPPT